MLCPKPVSRVNEVAMADQTVASPACTVLVVDDEPDIRHVLVRILTMAGYAVLEAAHGGAALAQVQHSPPRLVITDRMMPVMDGDELIEHLRGDRDTAGIPIVLLTGSPGVQPLADAMMMKPFNQDELLAVVTRLVERAA
jgi:CheY-like chemotaxis protein